MALLLRHVRRTTIEDGHRGLQDIQGGHLIWPTLYVYVISYCFYVFTFLSFSKSKILTFYVFFCVSYVFLELCCHPRTG